MTYNCLKYQLILFGGLYFIQNSTFILYLFTKFLAYNFNQYQKLSIERHIFFNQFNQNKSDANNQIIRNLNFVVSFIIQKYQQIHIQFSFLKFICHISKFKIKKQYIQSRNKFFKLNELVSILFCFNLIFKKLINWKDQKKICILISFTHIYNKLKWIQKLFRRALLKVKLPQKSIQVFQKAKAKIAKNNNEKTILTEEAVILFYMQLRIEVPYVARLAVFWGLLVLAGVAYLLRGIQVIAVLIQVYQVFQSIAQQAQKLVIKSQQSYAPAASIAEQGSVKF
ncbi:transmembrane protein, putative (macronuclear) [Tetrahymena thermophila SB210]|uniref:Transmembrane protein, putative n=1 Tax=Tetrahymena thermophila (strain SB210) TaxID=312017 RepID=W7XKG3_TETTS|nr:transmembrane protein, putative [Tetrahymena thermophila SB210]EWS74879.1 transmembrane protein, putative [Tetrahymena thermophila SB210]|eukprot:XP_012652592.1 transmembrane protein, putative [Tetrahymena thermophila SB210]